MDLARPLRVMAGGRANSYPALAPRPNDVIHWPQRCGGLRSLIVLDNPYGIGARMDAPLGVVSGPLTSVALSEVAPLLPDFGEKYPGGWEWLERRLSAANGGGARIWLSLVEDQIAALAIETPKGRHQSKLSTFAVHRAFRRCGVGRRLIAHFQRDWLQRDIDEIHVTVDNQDSPTRRFFERNGFVLDREITVRYGRQRIDQLLRWRADAGFVADAVALH